MFLKDIDIYLFTDELTEKEKKDFYYLAQNIISIILALLPKKFFLDGMSKTNIVIGENRPKKFISQLNVNVFCYGEFDFISFRKKSINQKQKIILDIIYFSFNEIAKLVDSDITEFKKVYKDIQKREYSLKIENQKVSFPEK